MEEIPTTDSDGRENAGIMKFPINVSAEFISTSGKKIIKGRDFRENAASESSNVIITQSLAKIIGEGSSIGRIIQSVLRQ